MKKRDLDWGIVGLVMSEFLGLFTIIRDILEQMKVGIEIIPWLCGEGKEAFVKEFLRPLGQKFLDGQRVRVVNETTIIVNLGASPKLPFEGAKVEIHHSEGWVEVQKREDGLYVGDRKVSLYLSERQSSSRSIQGYKLRDEVTGKDILNANLLDALLEHPHLIPEDWKKEAGGRIHYICFWATIYQDAGGGLYVRCLCFAGGHWQRAFHWLGRDFDASSPSAVRAS